MLYSDCSGPAHNLFSLLVVVVPGTGASTGPRVQGHSWSARIDLARAAPYGVSGPPASLTRFVLQRQGAARMSRRTFTADMVIGMTVAMITLAGGGSGVAAQATPQTGSAVAHPAHIHAGSCPEVGDVVFPLEELTSSDAVGAVMASPPLASGAVDLTGEVVSESTTEVEATLDDILAAEQAINVHASAEEIQTSIACGDVIGTPTGGELTIQLQELNDSGVVGEARLVDNADGSTTVTVSLVNSMGGTSVATPAT